jgi:hypothetical protein
VKHISPYQLFQEGFQESDYYRPMTDREWDATSDANPRHIMCFTKPEMDQINDFLEKYNVEWNFDDSSTILSSYNGADVFIHHSDGRITKLTDLSKDYSYKFGALRIEEGFGGIHVYKENDEYFDVLINKPYGCWRCDQLEGLFKLLEKNLEDWKI